MELPTVLNLALSAVLVWRYLRTGGPKMLRMMSVGPEQGADHAHAGHSHHDSWLGQQHRRSNRGSDAAWAVQGRTST